MLKRKLTQIFVFLFFTVGISNLAIGQEIVTHEEPLTSTEIKPLRKNGLVEFELQTKKIKAIEVKPKMGLISNDNSAPVKRTEKKTDLKKVTGIEKDIRN